MININEYLLGKNNKKSSVLYPEFGCDLENIVDWIESFGLEEQKSNSPSFTYYNKLVYKIFYNLNWVEIEYRTSNCYYNINIDLTKKDNSLISWLDKETEVRSYVDFNEAIKIVEKVLSSKDDIKKVIDIITNYKKYLKND